MSNSSQDSDLLVKEILALLGKVTDRFDLQENEEWQWIAQRSHNPAIIGIMQDSTATTMRVLDAIGRLEPVNGITISKHHRIPKGSVSKITRRLVAQKLIQTEALPNNKKEVLFRLTPLGRELFEVHRDFDQQMERGFVQFLHRYSADELRFLIRLLGDAADTSFLRLALHDASQDEAAARSFLRQKQPGSDPRLP